MIITLTRAEGKTFECNKPRVVDTLAQACSVLWNWSMSAPCDGGYHKCDFKIEDEAADFNYEGRYDLKHFSVEGPDLKTHCTNFLRFMGGIARPHHMTEEVYRKFLDQESPTSARRQECLDAADWLEKQP